MPAVGVIIPLYQSVLTIAQTLHSVQAQTITDWRAVVVNDGSTDDGPAIARAFAATDPRFTIIDQPNQGLPGARNTGIEFLLNTGAEYLHFLDADDLILPKALETLLAAATHTGLGAAYCAYEFLDNDAQPTGRQTAASRDVVGIDELLAWNRFVAHSQLIRADLLGADRFDVTLTTSEDYDLWLRLAARGVRWAGVDRALAGYRIRRDSMSKDVRRMAANETGVLARAFARLRAHPTPHNIAILDPSPDRERAALTHSALAYATRAALDPTAPPRRAETLFAEFKRDSPLEPGPVATATIFALQFAGARTPSVLLDDAATCGLRVDQWWTTLASRLWTIDIDPIRFVDSTLREYALRALHPAEIAREVLRRARTITGAVPQGGVVIRAPFDTRARWIGRVVSDEGLRVAFLCRDDTQAREWTRHDLGALSRCVAAPCEELLPGPGAILVMPAGVDGMPRATLVLDWDDARRDLAGAAYAKLRAAWDQDVVPARTGATRLAS